MTYEDLDPAMKSEECGCSRNTFDARFCDASSESLQVTLKSLQHPKSVKTDAYAPDYVAKDCSDDESF